jgi:Ser/Thr protein kinase RdoA (MazF antagonist)
MVSADGLCHLTEWIPGETPSPDDPEVLRRIGGLLGAVHAAEVTAEITRFGFRYEKWEQRNEANAALLLDSGALTRAEAGTLLARLAAAAPDDSQWTIIHADLAPENLVFGAYGDFFLVDNENLSVDAPGFDLARTWYRWPMTGSLSEAFLSGYREFADPGPFLSFAEFWTLSVLLEAACFRVAGKTPDAAVPLEPLRRLIDGSGKVPGVT